MLAAMTVSPLPGLFFINQPSCMPAVEIN